MNHLTGGQSSLHPQILRVMFGGLLLALLSVTVSAHSKLERSEPKHNSTLQQAPQLVELWFSEELQSGFNSIEVKGQQGKRFDQGGVTLSEGNKKVQIALTSLAADTYIVVWKVLPMDQHTLRGEFTFSVAQGAQPGAATASPPKRSGSPVMDSMPMEKSDEGFEISPSLSAVRWASYLAMMMLFGGFAIYLFVLAPALRQSSLEEPAKVAQVQIATAQRIAKWSWISIVLLFLTLFGITYPSGLGRLRQVSNRVVITCSAGAGNFQYWLRWALVFRSFSPSSARRNPVLHFQQAAAQA